MKIDQDKLDEFFSQDESDAAENKAKSKVRGKAKVKTAPKKKEKKSGQKNNENTASAATDAAAAIPEEDKVVIKLNPGRVTNTVFDWLGSLFIALVCVLLVMSFCFRVIDVDGTSMEPTLINTDKVVITDLFYTPHNGDVVVISHGENYDKPLVKRVIAIAGQTIRIDYDKNEVYVDDVLLDEKGYIMTDGKSNTGDRAEELSKGLKIPEGQVFVMGDNRTVSLDSRFVQIGCINVSDIIGKAQIVLIPHSYGEDGTPHLDLGRIRYIYN